MKILDHIEGVDRFGTKTAHVAVTDDDGVLYANHSSFLRGGCLYSGFVVLRNLKTSAYKEVEITSWASDSEGHLTYLLGLAEKHVGAKECV